METYIYLKITIKKVVNIEEALFIIIIQNVQKNKSKILLV